MLLIISSFHCFDIVWLTQISSSTFWTRPKLDFHFGFYVFIFIICYKAKLTFWCWWCNRDFCPHSPQKNENQKNCPKKYSASFPNRLQRLFSVLLQSLKFDVVNFMSCIDIWCLLDELESSQLF